MPVEKVVEIRKGKKVDAERKFFPGYVLARMEMTNEAFHLIANTPKVTGFLGADNKPLPISDKEAARILNQVQEGVDSPKPSVMFEVGESVRVSDGPFASFSGTVEEVDEEQIVASALGITFWAFANELDWVDIGLKAESDDRQRSCVSIRAYESNETQDTIAALWIRRSRVSSIVRDSIGHDKSTC